MKQYFLILILCLPFLSMAQDSAKATLREGSVITVQLLQDISSGSATTGDVILFETTEPVLVADQVVVPKGAKVSGRVSEATKRKGMGKPGRLNFSIDYLNLPDGKVVKLTSQLKADGDDKTGTAVAEAVLLTPLFLLKKGKDVKFPKGQVFKAFIEKDTIL